MVRAIAQLARAMNITTVAEYVETEEIRTRVRTLGVDYGQGFAIAQTGAGGRGARRAAGARGRHARRLPGRRVRAP